MKNKLFQNLILFGHKSSGKTFFGSLLAQELGRIFIDTDQWIENLYKNEFQETCNCRQIAIKIGEAKFRNLEMRVIDDLIDLKQAIIAVGGGTVLNPENCSKLEKIGNLVYLEADKETIKCRIFNSGIPSFLDSKDSNKSFDKMYEERKPIYEKIPAFKIKMHEKTTPQILEELKTLHSQIIEHQRVNLITPTYKDS